MRRIVVLGLALSVCLGLMAPSVVASAPDNTGESVSGSYIVVLDAGHPSQVAQEHARSHQVEVAHVYRNALQGYAAQMSPRAAQAIANDPRVAHVEADQEVYTAHHACGHTGGPGGDPCDDDDGDDPGDQITPWGIARIGADQHSGTGNGVSVYVLDTGIDPTHSDLADNMGDGFASEGCRGGGCAASWDDDHGHGTHVAGTVGAADNGSGVVGVAPEVTLHSVKVLSGSGSGSTSGVIAGIDWVAGHNSGQARIANMSLGGSGSKTGTCTSSGFSGNDAYHEAICEATRDGVVFVVAAGNSGADAAGAVPAAFDDTVITVSATSCSLSGQDCAPGSDDWTSWSNWGNNSAGWTSNASAPVAIAAPGLSILSTQAGGGHTTMSGTSMSSPHAAGVAALQVASANPSGSYSAFSQTRQAILGAAESTSNWSNTSGNPHDEDFLAIP
jgi:subtilisin